MATLQLKYGNLNTLPAVANETNGTMYVAKDTAHDNVQRLYFKLNNSRFEIQPTRSDVAHLAESLTIALFDTSNTPVGYLLGVGTAPTSQGAITSDVYSDTNIFLTGDGNLNARSYSYSSSVDGLGKVKVSYNTTDRTLDFDFL